MAISTNGGSNPTSVLYNGKTVSEVWYKSSPSATAVKVWPDTPTPTPTGKAYLTMNRWPKIYSNGNKSNKIDHDPLWKSIKIVSQENPNSIYFEEPQKIPFTCKFFPVVPLSDYPLQYWTLEKPDGTVLRFDDLDAHDIVIDQAGEWKEDSYWGSSPTPIEDVPIVFSKHSNADSTSPYVYAFEKNTDATPARTYEPRSSLDRSRKLPFNITDKVKFSFGGLCMVNYVLITINDGYENEVFEYLDRPGNISLNTKSLWVNFAKDSGGWYISGGNGTKVYLSAKIQNAINDLNNDWKNIKFFYYKSSFESDASKPWNFAIDINRKYL